MKVSRRAAPEKVNWVGWVDCQSSGEQGYCLALQAWVPDPEEHEGYKARAFSHR
jgi:predicted O-linked N-acetylglucosamine transferase (SPINDLY family)